MYCATGFPSKKENGSKLVSLIKTTASKANQEVKPDNMLLKSNKT